MKKELKRSLLLRTCLPKLSILKNYPSSISDLPSDFWPGSFQNGAQIFGGCFQIFPDSFELNKSTNESSYIKTEELIHILAEQKEVSSFLLARVHSFEWIRDLKMIQTYQARKLIRQFITVWIQKHHEDFFSLKSYLEPSCALDIMGYRMSNWISLFDFYGSSANDVFIQHLFKSLSIQFHIVRVLIEEEDDPVLISRAFRGFFWYLGFFNKTVKKQEFSTAYIQKMVQKYLRSVYAQLLDDCGHISYSGKQLFLTLRDLLEIRFMIRRIDEILEPKDWNELINVMSSLIRFFRHVDGQLSNFNGIASSKEQGLEPQIISSLLVDSVLFSTDTKSKPPKCLEQSGFCRFFYSSSNLIIMTKPSPFLQNNQNNLCQFDWSLDNLRVFNSCSLSFWDLSTSPSKQIKSSVSNEDSSTRIKENVFSFEFFSPKNSCKKFLIEAFQRQITLLSNQLVVEDCIILSKEFLKKRNLNEIIIMTDFYLGFPFQIEHLNEIECLIQNTETKEIFCIKLHDEERPLDQTHDTMDITNNESNNQKIFQRILKCKKNCISIVSFSDFTSSNVLSFYFKWSCEKVINT